MDRERLTPQRLAVLDTITRSRGHLTPTALYQRVSGEYPGIGRVTIYRTLDLLTRLGLLCRIHEKGDSRSYLMRRPDGHHHHLVCSGCGTVIDLTECDLGTFEKTLSRMTNFKIEGHLLEFHGRCLNCRETTPS